MDWLTDSDTLTAIGSLGAVFIAVLALYFSHRGESAKRLREQREELRGVLERLVSIREEQAGLVKEREESVKAAAAIWHQTKRTMYLEAAESLALHLLPHLTASELAVIALENYYDGDWIEARMWYERADRQSEHTSPVKRAEILRALASTYYVSDIGLLDPTTGADTYLRSIDALEGRVDHYSVYTRALCYRAWAASEISVQHLDKAAELLESAWQEWQRIPSYQAVAWLGDVRNLAFSYGHLGTAWFSSSLDGRKEGGQAAFRKGLAVTDALTEDYGSTGDYTVDVRGMLLQWWGQNERTAGDPARGRQLLDAAQQSFLALSEDFVWRGFRLGELERVRTKATPASPEEAAADPDRLAGAEDVTPVR